MIFPVECMEKEMMNCSSWNVVTSARVGILEGTLCEQASTNLQGKLKVLIDC